MSIHEIMFALFAGMITVFSVLTVTTRRILRAAIYLLIVLISTSGIYFMLNYQFLAAVQLTLYAGGIVVLIIFSILLTSHISHKFERVELKKQVFSAIAVIAGIVLTLSTILNFGFNQTVSVSENPDMQKIGGDLLSYGHNGYVLPFEVISILLLAAMFGAIAVAKKEKSK